MTRNPPDRLRFVLLPLVGFAAGVLSVLAARSSLDTQSSVGLRTGQFHLSRSEDDAKIISARSWIPLGYRFMDFDLNAEIELPENVDLDIVVRRVEPHVDDAARFHGRYAVLRMSTRDVPEFQGFLSRERALFDARVDAIPVAAGYLSSVQIEARGHRVRATVAGRKTDWFDCADDQGTLGLVLRGAGEGLIRYLDIQPIPRDGGLTSEWWAGGLFGGLGLLLAALARGRWRSVTALLLAPVIGWLAGLCVLSHLLPPTQPSQLGLVLAASSGVLVVIAAVCRTRVVLWVLAVLSILATWEGVVRLESIRIAPFEDPRLTAYFGAESGDATFDALAERVSGRLFNNVAAAGADYDHRIVFAGGGHVFEAGGRDALEENLGPQTAAELGKVLHGKKVEGIVLPSLYASIDQQLGQLERFVLPAFRPELVVFAVTSDELLPTDPWRPVDVQRGVFEQPSGLGSELLRMWRIAARGRVAPNTLVTLPESLDRLASLAKRFEFDVVTYYPELLSADLSRVVRQAIVRHGWKSLSPIADESTLERARRLANSLRPLFER